MRRSIIYDIGCCVLAFFVGLLIVPLVAQQVPVAGAAVYSGQVTVTTTATQLPSHGVRQVCLQETTGTSYIGPSTVTDMTGFAIGTTPVCLNVNNTAAIYIIAAGSETVTWVATTN